MLLLLIIATVLVLLLFGLLVYIHPNVFAGILMILSVIWMFRR